MGLGVSPFDGVSAWAVAGLASIYFLAFFIRGIIGFGSSMPAVLASAWLLPPHDAVLIALLASGFAQIQLLPQGFRDADWKIGRPMIAGMILSVAVGVAIFAALRAEWLTVVMGACLFVAVLADMARVMDRLAGRVARDGFALAFSLSAVAGLLAGVAGAGGNYFLSFYLRWVAPSPPVFRATNIVLSGTMTLWRVAVTAVAGLITLTLVVEAALVMPAVYAGGWAGRRFAGRLSAARYFHFLRIVLLLAAAGLIGKGVTALT